MTDGSDVGVNRRDLIQGALALSTLSVLPTVSAPTPVSFESTPYASVNQAKEQTKSGPHSPACVGCAGG